jgi:hypothetical protein
MSTCPKGMICINNSHFIGGGILALLVFYIVNREAYYKLYQKINDVKMENVHQQVNTNIKNGVTNNSSVNSSVNSTVNSPINNGNNDEMVLYNSDKSRMEEVLEPPLSRNYYHDPNGIKMIPKKAMPINISTRGDGGDYQQIGILYKDSVIDEEKAPGNNTDANVLPLFGKPVYRGASRYNYYTATDKYHQVKVPISLNNTDCTDDRGCDEINNGDTVPVPGYNANFKATIYKFDKPRYIPYV